LDDLSREPLLYRRFQAQNTAPTYARYLFTDCKDLIIDLNTPVPYPYASTYLKKSLVKILFAAGVLMMADINEVVVRGSAAGFAQEILAGRHPLTADEPVAAGGADTGPTPYDLLLAALGA
jgi:hypothetical protein